MASDAIIHLTVIHLTVIHLTLFNLDYPRGFHYYGREKSSAALRIEREISEQLTPRQIKIINLVWERKKVTSEEVRKKFKISRETVSQDFAKLIDLGLLVRKGAAKATYYVLGQLR